MDGDNIRSRSGPAGPIVVWMRGEHDISTDGALCNTLARAIALESSGVVLDLSEVEFVSASTLGLILAARELLSRQARSLTVRSPSAFVRRIIGAWGLDDLFGSSRQVERGGAGDAVGHATQVAAPVTVEPELLAEIA